MAECERRNITQPADWWAVEEYRKRLVALLRMRRDQRYRRGLVQMAVMADVIDQREWEYLERQIGERVGEPRLP